MSGGVVVGGQIVPVGPDWLPVPVLGTADHGIAFRPGEGHNRRRMEEIRACVWHWTGSERAPEKMAGTLKKRGYGVEFAISKLGVIYQFADPLKVDTADVGGFNAPSVGVEVVNSGYRRGSRAWILPTGRPTYEGRIHGVNRTFAGFYPAQVRAAYCLADALSSALDIPRCIPVGTDAAGNTVVHPSLIADKGSYRGHLGHFHVSSKKIDPGLDLLRALHVHFQGETTTPEWFVRGESDANLRTP